MSFGGLLWNGENFLPLGFDGLVEQDPFLHEVAYDFRPLIAHLLSNPKYKRMYVAHYKTMLTETISNDYYMERAEAMHDLISPYVETEPYPHYDFEDFNANITDDVGFWFDFRPGIASLMEERDAYINTLPEFMYLQPTILPVTVTPIAPEAYATVTFTTEVTDANLVEFNYRFNEFDYFVTQPMFDDGAHGDGVSGDGVYGVEIAILASDMEYYIYAENELAAKFAPVRAAHEFFTLIPNKGLVINELSADNESIITDEDGDYEDWIELFNNSEETISLGGYYLSDNASNLSKWTFPEVSIAAGEHLIVWADNDTIITDGLHANFKLSSAGEVLTLSNSEEQILDQISFTTQYEDITFGRFENGTGSFDYLYPTFAAENSAPVSLQEEEIVELSAYPNPANNQVTITYSTNQNTTLRLYSVSGRLVLEQSISDQSKVMLDISNLQTGLYILTDTKGRLFKLMVE